MGTLLRQEIFKLTKAKSIWITSALLVIFQVAIAILGANNKKIVDVPSLVVAQFSGSSWIVIFMIALTSMCVAMEYQYGTVKELFYRQYTRTQVLISKWLTMFLCSLYFVCLSLIVTVMLTLTVFGHDVTLGTAVSGMPLMNKLLLTTLGRFIGMWMILSLVFLLATLFKSSSAAISVGIIGYFITSIISSLQILIIAKFDWLKWNPLNMLNLSNQLVLDTYQKLTKLSTSLLVVGNLVYMVIFFAIGWLIFNRRNV